jgi:hypothetical protein
MSNPPTAPIKIVNHWLELKEELFTRMQEPCKNPTFILYFLGFVVVAGGFGLIEPAIRYFVLESTTRSEFGKALISAMYTYFMAVAATAAVDLSLSYHHRKSLKMLFHFAALVVFSLAIIAALIRPKFALIPCVFGYSLSLLLWWLGNAKNSNLLDDEPNPEDTKGKDPKTPPAGSVAGYQA